MNYYNDGTVEEGPAKELIFKLIHPSLEKLEPFNANCGAPAVRVLPGIPYRMKVITTGIQAVRFEYDHRLII